MITANDLKNMDYFLSEYSRIANYNKKNKELAEKLRKKIAEELTKIEIKTN